MLRDQAPAASTTTSAAILLPSSSTTPSTRPPVDGNVLDRRVLANGRARSLGGDAQGGGELAVVDLMVLRAPHRAGELAGQMRLAAAGLGGRNPAQRQAELLLIVEMMVDARLIVGGQRHHQRALGAQLDVDAGRLQQLRGKAGPARLALAPERDQRILAGLGLAAGRQHPGGGMACARSGRAAVEHLHGDAARGQPPGDAKPDHAGADDGDLRGSSDACRPVRQEAAPFAGMTQTGSMGVLSAAVPRHPKPNDVILGIFSPFLKCGIC